jgi:ubiquinone/menaquinone biosynthesis C-methylase UbiE
MLQKDIFLQGEANSWLTRNQHHLGHHDPVSDLIEQANLTPTKVLEIGCSNGWRLNKLWRRYGCQCDGIDPIQPEFPQAAIARGTADNLQYNSNAFDLVIFGFCLYLIDRQDLFKVVAESDRVLQDKGYLIIHDFESEPEHYATKYQHSPTLLSYHMDYTILWCANPAYTREYIEYHNDNTEVVLMRKDISRAWPIRETSGSKTTQGNSTSALVR